MTHPDETGSLSGDSVAGASPMGDVAGASRVRRFAWLPLPLLFVAALLIGWLQPDWQYAPRFLLLVLNTIFSTGVGILVAWLAADNYLKGGSLTVLLLGCGMLFFALAGFTAGILVPLGHSNAGVATYNIAVCLAASCHFLSALTAMRRPREDRSGWRRPLLLPAAYIGCLIGFALLTAASLHDGFPVFFVPGRGATVLRQVVLAAAVAQFAACAVLMDHLYRRTRAAFTYWYALGLALIACGLLTMALIRDLSGPLGWMGRGGQYLGGVYILIALAAAYRRSGLGRLPLEEALRESEERFRVLAEASFEGLVLSENGVIVDFNTQFAGIVGYEPSELKGMPVAQFIAPEDREQVLAHIRDGRETMREHELLRKDGTRVPVEAHGMTVRRGGSLARHTVMRDVSARKRAEKELALLARFPADNPNPVLRMDDADLVDYANPPGLAVLTAWGAAPGRPAPAQLTARAAEARLSRAAVEAEMAVGPDYYIFTFMAGRDGVNIYGKDITSRKRMEEALRDLNESLEHRVAERTREVRRQAEELRALAAELSHVEQRERRRLAGILHDHIQQLLVAARMQLEWIKKDAGKEETVEAVAQGVDSILREAIDASRSLTVELSPPVLHEAGLVAGLNWLAARMTENHRFRVTIRTDSSAEPAGEDVRIFLFDCVRELLFNALKHSGVSEAEVAVQRAEDSRVRIVVEDKGRGFDPALLSSRGSNARTFGLFSIEQRLAHIGGAAQIETAPGRGTRVTLLAPLGDSRPAAERVIRSAPPEEASLARKSAGAGKIRVLVVDDHKIMREGLRKLLQLEPGIEVVGEAADGPQAVDLAERLRPDVIVMDINLGEMSGIEATRIIVGRMPAVRVIGLSMHVDKDVKAAMRDAGAVAYVTKGDPSQDLVEAIRASLAR